MMHTEDKIVLENKTIRMKYQTNVYPGKPQFYYIKVGCEGSSVHGLVNLMFPICQ